MIGKSFSIQGYFEGAELAGDFAVIECILQDDRHWAASVLERADTKPRIVEWVRVRNSINPSRIIPKSVEHFIAVGPVGKHQTLSYQVDRLDDDTVKITPIAYLEPGNKMRIVIVLALFYVLPALFSPLVWHKYAETNLKVSRYYLNSFCYYLENRLTE